MAKTKASSKANKKTLSTAKKKALSTAQPIFILVLDKNDAPGSKLWLVTASDKAESPLETLASHHDQRVFDLSKADYPPVSAAPKRRQILNSITNVMEDAAIYQVKHV
jgi:hypothetical protein